MFTDNPLNDAITHINRLDSINEVETRICELYGTRHDVLEMVKDPDTNDYYCLESVVNGDLTKYLERNGYSEEMINNILNQARK